MINAPRPWMIGWATVLAAANGGWAKEGGMSLEGAAALVRTQYVAAATLSEEQLGGALLEGLDEALGGALEIETGESGKGEGEALREGRVFDTFVVLQPWRLGSAAEVNGFAKSLKAATNASGLVLDLRYLDGSLSVEHASRVIGSFVPAGAEMFRVGTTGTVLRASGPAPAEDVPLVVVIGNETREMAEVVAGTLRRLGRAVTVGAATSGTPALFDTVRLKDGRRLRFAAEAIVWPEGEEAFPDPVQPDVPVDADALAERALHAAGRPVVEVVKEEPPRDRPSEAALVRGESPEIDALRSRKAAGEEGAAQAELPPEKDRTLQAAVDVVRAIEALRVRESARGSLKTTKAAARTED